MAEPNENEFRGPINLKIKFRSASLDQFIERYAVDVSRGGIFIRTREPLAVGTRLKFDFQLLEAGPLLQGEGTVVWIREHDPIRATVTPGMGVRFDKITPESQQTLDKILAEKDRMQEGGVAPGAMTKSGAGIAVRRPTGAFVPLESAAPPPVPADAKPAKPAEPPPLGAAPAAAFPAAQARSTGIFGRPRATTGMSALRSAPVPSALFEAPTADDIDKALQVLEDKPGPVPAMPPLPRLTGATANPASPTPVEDEGSNEPTRVVDLAQEFAANEAITGKGQIVPEAGSGGEVDGIVVEDQTAKGVVEELASEAKTGAMQQTAKIAAASLDAPLGIHLDGAPVVAAPMLEAVESGRFRANVTYRRKRPTTLLVTVATLAVAGAAAGYYVLKIKPREAATVVAAPAPAPPPVETPPAPTPDPGLAAGAAVPTPPPAVKEPGFSAPIVPPREEPKLAGKDDQGGKTKDAKDQKGEPKLAPKEEKRAAVSPLGAAASGGELKPTADRSGTKRSRRSAEATTAAATAPTPEGAEAKPAADAPLPATAPEAAVANPTPPSGATPGTPEPSPPTPATAPPVFKISSTPAGAEVIVDGATVGKTPFSSKDIDPSAPHAITVRKDGFEAHERMISGSDWSKGRGGAQSLKINVKLRRSAAEAKEAAEPPDKKPHEVEILTPDSP